MVNEKERLLKMEHDAWLARVEAMRNAANIEYLAMMSDIDIDDEEVDEDINEDMEEEE